jgi:hypothetical protein
MNELLREVKRHLEDDEETWLKLQGIAVEEKFRDAELIRKLEEAVE